MFILYLRIELCLHLEPIKNLIRAWFQHNTITEENYLPPQLMNVPEMEVINALFACLPQEKSISDKASLAIGISIARLLKKTRSRHKSVCVALCGI